MLNIKATFEKNKFSKKNKESLLLLELTGLKNKHKTVSNKSKLNLSIAIDISGSMQNPVSLNQSFNRSFINPQFYINNKLENEFKCPLSKLDQAKKSAIKALDMMKDGDYISIIAFESNIHTICQATALTQENRNEIKLKINNLRCLGSTDLYNGWYSSAAEVAKNISESSINRVVVITDGQANIGLTDSDTISSHISKAYTAKISTTTFGIGEGFNEDLLQNMATSGCGNFYYVSDDNKLEEMFNSEFSGLSNLSATELSVKLELTNNVELIEQMNNFNLLDGKYNLNNISVGKTLPLLFKISYQYDKNKGDKLNIGKIITSYKDLDGFVHNDTIELEAEFISHKQWEKILINQEVKVQETLMIIANNKINVANAYSLGDISGARGMLQASASFVNSLNINDDRLKAQSENISKNLLDSETKSLNALRKDVTYESYQSRNGK